MLKLMPASGSGPDRKLHSYTALFALGLFAILAVNLYKDAPIAHVDFYDELWGPAHLLLQGKSPYDTSSLDPMEPAGWFPMAIGFFFPLGWLSEDTATRLWLIINVLEICVMIYVVQGAGRTIYNTIILAVLCFFFPPLTHHFALGQISLTVTLCLVLSLYFLSRDQEWMAAFSIALAFSKPHLALLPALGLYYHHSRSKRSMPFALFGKTFIMVLILCAPLFVMFSNWIPDAVKSMAEIHSWPHPSLFVFLPQQLGAWGYAVWGCIAIAVLYSCYLQWKYCSPRSAMYWSIAFSSFISPYVGSWDFVTLFPLLIFTFSEADWIRKILLIISYSIAWHLMVFVHFEHNGLNYYLWWVPLWMICTFALVTNWKVNKTKKDSQMVSG